MSRSLLLAAALALAPSARAQLLPPENPHAGVPGAPQPGPVPITNAGVVVEANQVAEADLGKGMKAKVLLTQKSTGEKDVGMAVLTAPKGSEIPMHRHRGSEVVYVLEGKGEVTAPGAKPQPFAAGDFIYNPAGVAHGVKTLEPSKLVVTFLPGGPELRYAGGTDPGTTPAGKDEPAQKKHAIVVHGAKLQPHPIFDGKATARIAVDPSVAPFANVSVALLEIQPDAQIPKLLHPHNIEVNYLLDGTEKVVLGAKELEATAPAAVRITPNVEHTFKVPAGKPAEVLVIFSPPGPEQTYLAAPKK